MTCKNCKALYHPFEINASCLLNFEIKVDKTIMGSFGKTIYTFKPKTIFPKCPKPKTTKEYVNCVTKGI